MVASPEHPELNVGKKKKEKKRCGLTLRYNYITRNLD